MFSTAASCLSLDVNSSNTTRLLLHLFHPFGGKVQVSLQVVPGEQQPQCTQPHDRPQTHRVEGWARKPEEQIHTHGLKHWGGCNTASTPVTQQCMALRRHHLGTEWVDQTCVVQSIWSKSIRHLFYGWHWFNFMLKSQYKSDDKKRKIKWDFLKWGFDFAGRGRSQWH